jgi:hypothetical protein
MISTRKGTYVPNSPAGGPFLSLFATGQALILQVPHPSNQAFYNKAQHAAHQSIHRLLAAERSIEAEHIAPDVYLVGTIA